MVKVTRAEFVDTLASRVGVSSLFLLEMCLFHALGLRGFEGAG
jgi:hypothetical protein